MLGLAGVMWVERPGRHTTVVPGVCVFMLWFAGGGAQRCLHVMACCFDVGDAGRWLHLMACRGFG